MTDVSRARPPAPWRSNCHSRLSPPRSTTPLLACTVAYTIHRGPIHVVVETRSPHTGARGRRGGDTDPHTPARTHPRTRPRRAPHRDVSRARPPALGPWLTVTLAAALHNPFSLTLGDVTAGAARDTQNTRVRRVVVETRNINYTLNLKRSPGRGGPQTDPHTPARTHPRTRRRVWRSRRVCGPQMDLRSKVSMLLKDAAKEHRG